MAESITITGSTKSEIYRQLIPQVAALVDGESDLIANCANVCSAIHTALSYFWVGFYFVKGEELVLGPFQGSIACTRIKKGKGVCGSSWEKNQILIVQDVDQFPGHIACSSLSKSEIVIPFYNKRNEIIGVLDVDHNQLAAFDETDAEFLSQILKLISPE